MNIEITQNEDQAIEILRHASVWMIDSDLPTSDWWNPDKLSRAFFKLYAKPDEFYVATMDGELAAAIILQKNEQNMQDWGAVDGNTRPKALYIPYLAVERSFAGKGLPRALIEFSDKFAHEAGLPVLRLDTNADEIKLCSLYEGLGFKALKIIEEGHRRTVLYERTVQD